MNPDYKGKIDGKHILVIDDFRTMSYSFECARNLLLLGDAKLVTCISLGCYRANYIVKIPKKGIMWDPWRKVSFHENDFHSISINPSTNNMALNDFFRTLELFK